MKKFPIDIIFKHSWRQYQQRVLDNLKYHLQDNKLHIVAPPGSGKTVLGLEVMLRLNKPTLILAPTLAVRNQWIERFCELFLQVDEMPDWISRDLRQPKFLTVSTYQGLYAAFNNLKSESDSEEEEEIINEEIHTKNSNGKKIISLLRGQNIKTIILDEAHHLKKEWWKSLDYLEKHLEPTIIGLTATPPYDVTGYEWERYISLNGAIDEEIFVPELVSVGDLCPHQDYIYFSMPDVEERGALLDLREKVNTIYTKLRQEQELIIALEEMPFIKDPMHHLDWIYENLQSYMACLILINDFRGTIDKLHLEVLGDQNAIVPMLSYMWLEKALEFYCFKAKVFYEEDKQYEESVEKLISRLRRYGAMEHRQIRLGNSQKENAFLTSSVNKLTSIKKIVAFESANLKEELRMVILSDYIRKEVHVQKSENDSVLAKLGVVPIFEYLRRDIHCQAKLGILTGSLVFIPVEARKRFEELLLIRNVKHATLKVLPYDAGYLEVSINESLKNTIIQIVTALFEEGYVEVLIGTKALLGEGWDAPAINSLILASFVGSFVSSNQMRGRAIRSQRDNPTKTSTIWHLVCLDPYVEDGGSDRQVLTRRFQGFSGVSNEEDEAEIRISNGTQRLKLPRTLRSQEEIDAYNDFTFALAKDRNYLHQRWKIGIEKGTDLVHTMKIPFIPLAERTTVEKAKEFYSKQTIQYSIVSLVTVITMFILNKLGTITFNAILWGAINMQGFFMWLINVVFACYVFKFGKRAKKTYMLSKKYRDIGLDINNIAQALVDTLCEFRFIKTAKDQIVVECQVQLSGSIRCALKGGTILEGNLFVSCMQELLSPIDNPRYILERKSFLAYASSQSDYHTVPVCIAAKRNMVDYFGARWRKLVGPNHIVYTRTPQGRKQLLQARIKALSNQLLDNAIVEENVWM